SVLELKRAAVLARVKAGDLTLRQGSELLHLGYRQTKRLWRKFRRGGPASLRHGNVGRRSNRRKEPGFKRKVLRMVRREFGGDATHERFGPTLAAEHLAEEFGLLVHHETLRRWMLADGLWSRARAASAHRKRRERKRHFGELVQLDGSFEEWLEDRAPVACLMNMVDDATSTCGLRFEPQETIWGAVRSLRAWIGAYGIPMALYTDWKNVYVRKPTEAEIAAGTAALTQFGRMCATLAIRIIAASSPQAKGRVERNNGTHQDRLIKKMRRKGIATYEAGNAFLADTYIPAHNARFAKPAASPEDFHTPVPPGVDLDQVFRLETPRTVSNDWVVRHGNRLLQLERQGRHYPPARSRVLVCEYEDGHFEVWYREQRVRWTEITGRPQQTLVAAPPPAVVPPPRPQPPSATHPWKRAFRDLPDRLSPGERIPGHVAPMLYGGAR
ncbi:MAG TPA: ISNCY family transposase, partial [Vicinamibacterales bacterium]|nr:ISNCY family transposase [Vicinamibacterales bacterium]